MIDIISEVEPTSNLLLEKASELQRILSANDAPALPKATPLLEESEDKENHPENLVVSSELEVNSSPTNDDRTINTDAEQEKEKAEAKSDQVILDILATNPEEVAMVSNLPPTLFTRNNIPCLLIIAHALFKAACMYYTFSIMSTDEPFLLKVLEAFYYLITLLPWILLPVSYYVICLPLSWYYGLEVFEILPMMSIVLVHAAIYCAMAKIPNFRPYQMILKQTSFPDL